MEARKAPESFNIRVTRRSICSYNSCKNTIRVYFTRVHKAGQDAPVAATRILGRHILAELQLLVLEALTFWFLFHPFLQFVDDKLLVCDAKSQHAHSMNMPAFTICFACIRASWYMVDLLIGTEFGRPVDFLVS